MKRLDPKIILSFSFFFMIHFNVSSQNKNFNSVFWEALFQSQISCPHLQCPKSLIKKTKLTQEQWRSLSSTVRKELQALAKKSANDIWPDTILEGDYIADYRVRLDAVELLTLHDEFVGYWILYSARAWDTSTCDYDPLSPNTIKNCQQGRIYEGSFTNFNFSESLIDINHLATFKVEDNKNKILSTPFNQNTIEDQILNP